MGKLLFCDFLPGPNLLIDCDIDDPSGMVRLVEHTIFQRSAAAGLIDNNRGATKWEKYIVFG